MRKSTQLTAMVLLAVFAGYLAHHRATTTATAAKGLAPGGDPEVASAPAGTREVSAAVPPAGLDEPAAAAHPLAMFKDAATDNPAGVDPMIVFALESFSDEQIAAYNELHVIPFNPAIGKLCERQPDPQFPGMDLEMARCETIRERPPHPYMALSDDELQVLAETDPAAAEIMGMRVVGDDAERNRWYLRAAALSGKSGPILALANRRYSNTLTYKRSVEGLLEPVTDVVAVRYRAVLETIAARMGDPRANPSYWRSLLTPDVGEGQAVERDATEIMQQMARIQREVTGSTQMWELIDAA